MEYTDVNGYAPQINMSFINGDEVPFHVLYDENQQDHNDSIIHYLSNARNFDYEKNEYYDIAMYSGLPIALSEDGYNQVVVPQGKVVRLTNVRFYGNSADFSVKYDRMDYSSFMNNVTSCSFSKLSGTIIFAFKAKSDEYTIQYQDFEFQHNSETPTGNNNIVISSNDRS